MCPGDTRKMVARPITVIQMLPGLEGGGVERGTLEMGAYLSRKGHRSIVVSEGGRLVPQLVEEGSSHLNWRAGAKNPVSLAYLIPLRKLMIREKVDILHLRSRMPAWIGFLAWKSLPIHLRPRLVTTFHGFYSVNAYSAIMTKGERIIAISKAVEAHIKTAYGISQDRIQVIYRGFDEGVFDPEKISGHRLESLRHRWGINRGDGPVVILPGRITRLKGHDTFITSLSGICDLSWQAICVGDPRENPGYVRELRQMVSRLGLEKRIKFVGYCDDMAAALTLADVAVSATSGTPEAFGRVVVEAQAMGKPVIASAHGGSIETVLPGRTGWLVTPGDPGAMSKALGQALTEIPLREEYGRNARRWVKEKFTVDKMCTETIDLYYRLLRQPPGPYGRRQSS